MPRYYKQFSEILGLAEEGDLQADLTTEMNKVIEAARDAAGAKGSASSTLSLKLTFTVEGVHMTVASSVSSTVPKQPRRQSMMFVSEEGISREHPKQRSIFDREDDHQQRDHG